MKDSTKLTFLQHTVLFFVMLGTLLLCVFLIALVNVLLDQSGIKPNLLITGVLVIGAWFLSRAVTRFFKERMVKAKSLNSLEL